MTFTSSSNNDTFTRSVNNSRVALSNKPFALTNAESIISDDDDSHQLDEIVSWQKTILNGFQSNRQPLARRKSSYKKKLPSSDPSEKQLLAHYVEEQQPEQPNYMKHPSIGQSSDLSLLCNPGTSQSSSRPSTSLRKHLKKASLLNTINRVFTRHDRHLQDTGNFGALLFFSPSTVPFLWAKLDFKGRKAPPVLLDALKLAITDSYNDDTYNWQSVFRIELKYGDVKWVIKRIGFDFVMLYLNLKKRNDLPHIPRLPTGIIDWFKAIMGRNHQSRQAKHQAAALQRRKDLENYLIELITVLKFSVAYDLYEFFELSAISITRDMGWKGKECYMDNKVERFRTPICSFKNSNEKWIKEWIIVRDSSPVPADVFLIDKYFKCEKLALHGLDRVMKRHGRVIIENSSRRIEIKGDARTLKEFFESIEKIKRASPWVIQHRFNSYAPIRENVKVKWYVDGKDYFFAVSQAIMAAKAEIYIEDWWLSPELYLRRPPSKNEEYRLDRLLKKKAEEGVMIYIIVYKEVKLALSLDSWHTKSYLQSLHPNIRVQRHPDHGPEGTVFWAHHEKMVVIDCRLAFIGGLDLCFGRYDTHQHELIDFNRATDDNISIWPGQDYSNPRVKDFVNVANYDAEIIDKSRVPRMAWHDVSIGTVGHPARDIARHFVQRWNFIKEEKAFGREKFPFLTPKAEYVSTRDESKFFGTCDVQLLRSSDFWSSGIKLENSIYNAYCHLIRTSKHFIYIENQFFITSTGPDPSHPIKNRIGECIVERIKKAHKNKEKFRIIVVMPLLPAFEADLNSKDAGTIRLVMHWQYTSICRGGRSILEKLSEAGINPENYISFFALRGHDKIHDIDGHHSSTDSDDQFLDENSQHIANERIGGEPALPDGIKQKDSKQLHVTEEVYIHSKLMIVDDRFVLCGSDSEIAIVIEDKKTVDTFMDGKKYKASKFAYTLRKNIFKEHLGLLEPQDHSTITKSCLPPLNHEDLFIFSHEKEQTVTSLLDEQISSQKNKSKEHPTRENLIMDPLSDEFYDYWSKTAQDNTEIYRSVFKSVPDDNITDWEQYKKFVSNPTTMPIDANSQGYAEVERKLSNVKGHLVQFPTEFLNRENLMGSVTYSVTLAEIFT
ncbi:11919_t:CDS:10 [Funneliformis mosseae]|uniref:Phospholipase n=1 Tax=Funneliformis mosseae TaxID=27381 RepID=A0A9N9FDE0_FUNMO|nr:11919_t:CDS:10 [Funneliformis mosseae]